MRTFADTTGRAWQLALTIGAVKRVQGLLPGVNLADLTAGDPPLITRLDTDPIFLADVVYALVKPQADTAGLTDEQFAALMGGDALNAAREALKGELVDFFRSLRRPDVVQALEKQEMVLGAAIRAASARIDAISPESLLEQAQRSGRPSTRPPGSSESIPPG